MNCLGVVPMWIVIDERGHFQCSVASMKVKKSVFCVYHCENVMKMIGL